MSIYRVRTRLEAKKQDGSTEETAQALWLERLRRNAGVGAGAGIAYLLEGTYEAIAHTIVNAVAILSGTICDGAKPSCAAKIAASVDAGILGYRMYCHRQEFKSGDGIVTKGVDNTIRNIGLLAKEGMHQTDRTILDIMTHRCE